MIFKFYFITVIVYNASMTVCTQSFFPAETLLLFSGYLFTNIEKDIGKKYALSFMIKDNEECELDICEFKKIRDKHQILQRYVNGNKMPNLDKQIEFFIYFDKDLENIQQLVVPIFNNKCILKMYNDKTYIVTFDYNHLESFIQYQEVEDTEKLKLNIKHEFIETFFTSQRIKNKMLLNVLDFSNLEETLNLLLFFFKAKLTNKQIIALEILMNNIEIEQKLYIILKTKENIIEFKKYINNENIDLPRIVIPDEIGNPRFFLNENDLIYLSNSLTVKYLKNPLSKCVLTSQTLCYIRACCQSLLDLNTSNTNSISELLDKIERFEKLIGYRYLSNYYFYDIFLSLQGINDSIHSSEKFGLYDLNENVLKKYDNGKHKKLAKILRTESNYYAPYKNATAFYLCISIIFLGICTITKILMNLF